MKRCCMIPILVFSNDKIAGQIKRALEEFFSTSLVCENWIDVVQNTQILLLQHKTNQNLKTDGIAVFSDSFSSNSEICTCSTAIVDSSSCRYINIDSKAQYITCGMSTKDAITFSSIDDREVCISLLREIRDIYGNEIEPFEVSIETDGNITSAYSPFSLLAFVALTTVLGKNISGQKLFLK